MHVVMNGPLSSPDDVLIAAAAGRLILGAARAAHPLEACGLLFGTPGRILEATVARNVAATPRTRFEIDPAHLFDAHRRARQGPLSILGCWHSHPDGGPFPSTWDQEGVCDAGWLWLIAAGGRIRAFLPVADGQRISGFAEAPLRELPFQ